MDTAYQHAAENICGQRGKLRKELKNILQMKDEALSKLGARKKTNIQERQKQGKPLCPLPVINSL